MLCSEEMIRISAPAASGAFSAITSQIASSVMPPGIVPGNRTVRFVALSLRGTSSDIQGARPSMLLRIRTASASFSACSRSSPQIFFAVLRISLRFSSTSSACPRPIRSLPSRAANMDFFSGTYRSSTSSAWSAAAAALSNPALCPAVSILRKYPSPPIPSPPTVMSTSRTPRLCSFSRIAFRSFFKAQMLILCILSTDISSSLPYFFLFPF